MGDTFIDLFIKLSRCNDDIISNIVDCEKEFVEPYNILILGNGGGWCRFDGKFGKIYKVCIMRANKKYRLSWPVDDAERDIIIKEFEDYCMVNNIIKKKGNRIRLIKFTVSKMIIYMVGRFQR